MKIFYSTISLMFITFVFCNIANAENQFKYVNQLKYIQVTNIPCKLDICYKGINTDSSGKTNVIFNYVVEVTGNKEYYLQYGLGGPDGRFKIWSISKEMNPDKQLFPVPILREFSNDPNFDTNDCRVTSNKPYINNAICPLELLINSENGLIGSVGICEYEIVPDKTNSTNSTMAIIRAQTIYSDLVKIPKK